MTIHTKFWVGTSGWTYADWAGVFYPENYPQKLWLQYYSQQFDTVELNATFYRNFSEETYQHWYEKVPDNFRFIIKASRYITHRKYLKNVKSSIKIAEKSANLLRDKLGLILLQLPPSMPYDLDRLRNALAAFKIPSQVVVEFRNAKWSTLETKQLLTEFNAVYCNVDSPNERIAEWLTSDIGYIRLHGRKEMYKYNYTKPQLIKIAASAKNLAKQGAKEVYIFFNNDYFAHAIKNAKTLLKLLHE